MDYQIHPPSNHGAASAFTLDSYIVHRKPTTCAHCGTHYETCTVWEVYINPSMTGRTAAHRLAPAKSIRPGFPVGCSLLQPETIPCCHSCFQTLPLSTGKLASPEEWSKTLQRKYAPEAPAPKAPKVQRASSSRHIPSLDEL